MAVTREVQTPSLFYRATGHVNRVVWQRPLPRRVLARLSRMAYRNPPMPAEAVLSVVDALEQAGVRFWLWGGWGVDALAGSESRVHRDLDLVVDHRDLTTAASTLVPLGYSEWYRIESERPLFARIVLHDHEVAGRAVDLHPVDLDRNPLAFAPGSIAGRTRSCVAPELQLSTHTGYRPRRQDRVDLAVIRRLLTRPVSTLVVPVPAANHLLDESAREQGMPAHVTLVYPFMPTAKIGADTEAALAELCHQVAPFEFTLARVDQFPGVQYLAPEPVEPFVELGRLF